MTMIRKGIVIDCHTKFEIIGNCEYEDRKVDGMYYKIITGMSAGELIPAAYIYPVEHREAIFTLLCELKDAKKAFDDIQSRVFYKDFPKYRP